MLKKKVGEKENAIGLRRPVSRWWGTEIRKLGLGDAFEDAF